MLEMNHFPAISFVVGNKEMKFFFLRTYGLLNYMISKMGQRAKRDLMVNFKRVAKTVAHHSNVEFLRSLRVFNQRSRSLQFKDCNDRNRFNFQIYSDKLNSNLLKFKSVAIICILKRSRSYLKLEIVAISIVALTTWRLRRNSTLE